MRIKLLIIVVLFSQHLISQNKAGVKEPWLSVSVQTGVALQNLGFINNNWYDGSGQIPANKTYWSNGFSMNASLGNFQLFMQGNHGSFEFNPSANYQLNVDAKLASLNIGYAFKLGNTKLIPIVGIGNSNLKQIATQLPTTSTTIGQFVKEERINYTLIISAPVLNYGFRWQYNISGEKDANIKFSHFSIGGYGNFSHNISDVKYHSLDGTELTTDSDFLPSLKNLQVGFYLTFYIL